MELIDTAQNTDGGWPYQRGRSSWTEPSVFALLSTSQPGLPSASFQKGINWLKGTQNSDGGWSAQPATGPSTWVTALAALLPPASLGEGSHQRAVKWLLDRTGQESSTVNRVRQWMLGNQDFSFGAEKGWPWYPGAAAWVMPTALSLLALRKERSLPHSDASDFLKQRIQGGTQYLLVHSCKQGGWNHGSTHALGYEAGPYPETTGVALLALRGVKAPEVERGIEQANRFYQGANCAGESWLRLGLLAQGCEVPAVKPDPHGRKQNVLDEAIHRLSENPNVLFI